MEKRTYIIFATLIAICVGSFTVAVAYQPSVEKIKYVSDDGASEFTRGESANSSSEQNITTLKYGELNKGKQASIDRALSTEDNVTKTVYKFPQQFVVTQDGNTLAFVDQRTNNIKVASTILGLISLICLIGSYLYLGYELDIDGIEEAPEDSKWEFEDE